MRSHSKKLVAVLTYGVFLLGCSLLQAEETTAPPKPVSLGEKVRVATSFRASKLAGLNVRDGKGEKLGSVEDLVMDVKTGKISYLAMSFGMTLGLGGKLFAVPYDQVQFDHGKDEMYFIVHIPKDETNKPPVLTRAIGRTSPTRIGRNRSTSIT